MKVVMIFTQDPFNYHTFKKIRQSYLLYCNSYDELTSLSSFVELTFTLLC